MEVTMYTVNQIAQLNITEYEKKIASSHNITGGDSNLFTRQNTSLSNFGATEGVFATRITAFAIYHNNTYSTFRTGPVIDDFTYRAIIQLFISAIAIAANFTSIIICAGNNNRQVTICH